MKIAVTGASGLIGSRIIELLKNDFTFIPLSNDRMDVTNEKEVNSVLRDVDFDLLLHLAAYTSVDGAELEKERAYAINVSGTGYILSAVKAKNKKLVYVSTDFIFDGIKPPFREDSSPNPLSYYGLTKLQGENLVKNFGMIVRLAYPYRSPFPMKKDFVQSILGRLKANQELLMVTDSLITPTFVDDIAYGLKFLLYNYSSGTYHLVGADSLSPFQAAKTIAEIWKLDQNLIKPTTFEDYQKNKARRPQFSQIISTKNTFWPMKSFREGLKIVYDISL